MSQLRATVTAGALAGCVSIFLALVGLTDRFADLYFVGDEASFGRLMLIIAPFTVGAILAKPRVVGGEVEERTAALRKRRSACTAAVSGFRSSWIKKPMLLACIRRTS